MLLWNDLTTNVGYHTRETNILMLHKLFQGGKHGMFECLLSCLLFVIYSHKHKLTQHIS
jgi:hypothetical protein